jgi:hypothetical protein
MGVCLHGAVLLVLIFPFGLLQAREDCSERFGLQTGTGKQFFSRLLNIKHCFCLFCKPSLLSPLSLGSPFTNHLLTVVPIVVKYADPGNYAAVI